MLTSVPDEAAQQPADETLFLVPVPSVSRVVLSPVVSLTFPPPALREDLETYEGAFTIFCASESPRSATRSRGGSISGVMKIRPVFVSAGPVTPPEML